MPREERLLALLDTIAARQQEQLVLQRKSLALQRRSVERDFADAATGERQRGSERLRDGVVWLLAAFARFSLARDFFGR